MEQDLKRIEEEFQKAVTAKQQLQEKSDALRRKMDSANSLLDALSGERDRWSAQREEFDGQIFRLVGDASVSSAFLCYCGPYNSTFREKIVEVCREDMKKRQVWFLGVRVLLVYCVVFPCLATTLIPISVLPR